MGHMTQFWPIIQEERLAVSHKKRHRKNYFSFFFWMLPNLDVIPETVAPSCFFDGGLCEEKASTSAG